MKYTIQKIPRLSGHRASIYTVLIVEESETLLNRFLRENSADFPNEVKDILQCLHAIGHQTGARSTYFKPNEV